MEFPNLGPGNQIITIEDTDWQATPDSVKLLIGAMAKKILSLEAKISALEERLNTNSRNSGKPSSTDPPGSLPNRGKTNQEGRKPGGQPGHPGNSRRNFQPNEIDKIVDRNPNRCDGCGFCLEGVEASDYIPHQVAELPEKLVFVFEYRLHAKTCPCCQAVNRGELPEGVSLRKFGPRLISAVSMMTGTYHMSRRDVVDLLCRVLGIEMSVGTVSSLEGLVTEALQTVHEDLSEAIQEEDAINMDDSGWRQDNKYACLWALTSPSLALYKITPNKSSEAAANLLGSFKGVLTSDRAKNLDFFTGWRQTCWAHLDRHFKRISERPGLSAQVGLDAMQVNDNVFAAWRRFRQHEIDQDGLLDALQPERDRLRDILTRGLDCGNSKTENTCQNILDIYERLWTFAYLEGVEPTNNAAERALRDGVLWKKTSYGSQSVRGTRFVEAMLSVSETCRKQGLSIMGFLGDSLNAFFKKIPGPTLRPAPS